MWTCNMSHVSYYFQRKALPTLTYKYLLNDYKMAAARCICSSNIKNKICAVRSYTPIYIVYIYLTCYLMLRETRFTTLVRG